ncbi:MAG: hypothetical protein HY735_07355 [Verrucomicrobia bacterium]|nr:hypothetical protein [Verrucomicrobiota bacterium]
MNLKAIAPAGTQVTETRLLFPLDDTLVWSGALNPSALAELTNSAARTEIVRRLLSGESGVWILLESGQKNLDDSEAARLDKRLAFLKTVASLPPIDPADPTSRLGPGPALRVKFSTLRLRSNDAGESVLRTMLRGPLANQTPPPAGMMAALVFGRGRVLGAWPMKELGDESIDEASLYLLGACSCQVKQLNPGWDLLLSVDWEQALLEAAAFGTDKTVQATEEVPSPKQQTVTIHPQTDPRPDDYGDGSASQQILLALAGAALFACIALLRRICR